MDERAVRSIYGFLCICSSVVKSVVYGNTAALVVMWHVLELS